MICTFAFVAIGLVPARPVAPAPRAVRGWVTQHTFTHKAPVRAVTATPGAFVTGDKNGVLLLWDARTGALRETLLDGTNEALGPIDAVRPTPDGKRLCVVARDRSGQIQMTGKERTLYGPDPTWPVFGFSHEGQGFANDASKLFGDAGTLCVLQQFFEVDNFGAGLVYRFQHPVEVRRAASATGVFVSADARDTVRRWKPKRDEVVETAEWAVDLHKIEPQALAVSPDGALIAVAGGTGAVEVLEARKGEPVATLKGHNGAVRAVAFAPDSGLLATGGADGTVRFWNPWTGEPEGQLKAHTAGVGAVWFASDEVLMTASDDKTARVWVYQP